MPRISASPLVAPGSGCSSRSSWCWAPPAGARCPQPALPLLHTGNLPCCTSSGPRAHGCAEAGAHSHRGAALLSAAAAQVSRAVAHPAAGLAWDGHFDGWCAMCAQVSRRPERAAAAAPTCQPGGRHLPTRCRRWLRALFGPPLPAVCSLMPPAGASLLLADNPPSTHLTNPEPLDGARHEGSAVRVRPSPPNPALTQPLLVRFCSR